MRSTLLHVCFILVIVSMAIITAEAGWRGRGRKGNHRGKWGGNRRNGNAGKKVASNKQDYGDYGDYVDDYDAKDDDDDSPAQAVPATNDKVSKPSDHNELDAKVAKPPVAKPSGVNTTTEQALNDLSELDNMLDGDDTDDETVDDKDYEDEYVYED